MKEAIKGLELNKYNYNLLNFLIESEEDVENFIQNFWTGKNQQFFSVRKFRKYKMDLHNLSFEDFEKQYIVNPKEALEKLFQHPVTRQDCVMVKQAISIGEFTLEELYKRVKDNPELSLLRQINP